ncbi:hypothetical protein ACHAXN_003637 [Cyclotella atomus]
MDSDSIDPGSNPGGTCPIRDSIVASIPACHAGDRGSIPRRGVLFGYQRYCQGYFLGTKNIVLE